MEFKKYCSIENSSRIKNLNDIIEYGLSYGEWVVSEKVHGANFSFWMNSEGVRAARRTDFLTLNDNFSNFEYVWDRLDSKLKEVFQAVLLIYNLKAEETEVVLFGELFGGLYPHPNVEKIPTAKCVQKGVFYSPDNSFYAFDMKVNGKYINLDVFENIMENVGIFYAKTLYKGFLKEVLAYPNEFQSKIPEWLGLPPIENNVCEGVVLKPVVSRYFSCGSRVILKNKNEKFSEKAHAPKEPKEKIPRDLSLSEDETNILSNMLSYVTENRLRNVLSKMNDVTDKMFGQLQGLFTKDIIEDFNKDQDGVLESLKKARRKIIQTVLGNEVRSFVRERFLNIIDKTF